MKLYEFFGGSNYSINKPKEDQTDSSIKTQEDREKLVDDVYWYLLDDDQLHKEFFLPTARKILILKKSKTFDKEKFLTEWLPMVNKGCMKFYKENEMTEDPKDIFTKEIRKDLCQRLCDQACEDIDNNEYTLD